MGWMDVDTLDCSEITFITVNGEGVSGLDYDQITLQVKKFFDGVKYWLALKAEGVTLSQLLQIPDFRPL